VIKTGIQIFKNATILLSGYDISGDSNKVALSSKADVKDRTTFNNTARRRVCGLLDTSISAEGFFDPAKDAGLFDFIASGEKIIAVSAAAGIAGDLVYFAKCQTAEYTPMEGAIGELAAFRLSGQGSGPLIRGQVLERGEKTATAPGTAANIGAVLATQKVYACLQVLAVSGTNPTLDLEIQSDDAQAMSSPIDRITFDQMTEVGAQWKELAGPVADTWWRVNYTLGGIDPSFVIAVLIGIK
jgi:hypothetical protein